MTFKVQTRSTDLRFKAFQPRSEVEGWASHTPTELIVTLLTPFPNQIDYHTRN